MNKLDFLNKIVFGYIKKDLENIKTLPKRDEGGCNFPIALCVLSYMEYLGSFFTGNEFDFPQNITAYIDKCFRNKNDYNVDILKDLFRDGLAHDYFPRGGVGRDSIRPGLYVDYNGDVILDADTLMDDFLNSLDLFRDELEDQMYQARIELAGNKIKKWKEDRREAIEKLIHISSIVGVRTSGTSIYPGRLNITRAYDPNEK